MESILILIHKLDDTFGGPVSVFKGSTLALQKYFRIKVIQFSRNSNSDEVVSTHKTIGRNIYSFPLNPWKLRYQIRSGHDLILIHGFYYGYVLFALLFCTQKIIILPHGSLEEYQQKKNKYLKYIYHKLFSLLVKMRKINITFYCTSISEKIGISQLFSTCRIIQVDLGVEEEFLSTPVPIPNIHSELNVISLSRIAYKKRIDLAIDAVNYCVKSNFSRKIIFRIFGDGSQFLKKSLSLKISEFNLNDQVFFSGFLSSAFDRIKALDQSDVFILLSDNENYAVAVAESVSRCKPVIISNFVGISRFIETNKLGIVLPNRDAAEVAKALIEINQNYEYYVTQCKSNRMKLSWETTILSWIENF